MGLLDIFDTPEGQQALNLLAASGPQTDPTKTGFGQRIQSAMQATQAQRDAEIERQFKRVQMDNYRSEIEQRNAALKKQQWLMDKIGGLSGTPGQPSQGGGLANLSPDNLAMFKANGVDLTDIWKETKNGFKREPGASYNMPDGSVQMGPPKLDNNIQATPDLRGGWTAAATPGAVGAVGQLKGAEEDAKAAVDPYLKPMPGGGKQLTSRLKAMKPDGNGNDGSPAGNGLDLSRVSPDTLKRLLQQDPQAVAEGVQLWNQSQNRGSKQAGGEGYVPSEAQTRLTSELGTELVKNYSTLQSIPQTLKALDSAKDYLSKSGGFVGSGADTKLGLAKFFNNNLGTNIDPSGVANAEALQSALFYNVMDNLKKMDASPSQEQQRLMQSAFGKLTTDPTALPMIIDFYKGQVASKANEHNRRVNEMAAGGITFPYDISIKTGEPSAPAKVPVAKGMYNGRPVIKYSDGSSDYAN